MSIIIEIRIIEIQKPIQRIKKDDEVNKKNIKIFSPIHIEYIK